MMQSNLTCKADSEMAGALHVGIIMDGNGRWGTLRGLTRTQGHQAGVKAVRRTVAAAPFLGIDTLTLFAFSSDNWKRPPQEVDGMMRLIEHYVSRETRPFVAAGIRLSVIGRRDRLPARVVRAIEDVERETASGSRLNVRIAIDYCGRHAILEAALRTVRGGAVDEASFCQQLATGSGYRDVDLVIRTSGEQRLSGFLPWEATYAELHFCRKLWPDFTGEDLAHAISDFRSRNRRFGGLKSEASAHGGTSHVRRADALAGKIISSGLHSPANCF
jgi:undecaprenyl diphosphate synthase